MELGEILEQIKKRWTASERYELIVKLDKAPDGAQTGTEGMALMGQFLLRLKRISPDAFYEIEDLITEYVKMSAKRGLRLIE